jgi:galactose-1-phosphate uridylyltransferase
MIEFKKSTIPSRWLNPGSDLPQEMQVEWRTDPLNGDVGMVLDLPVRPLEKTDFKTLAARSLERPCPFCPENFGHTASKYPPEVLPEGRLSQGRSHLIANIVPWVPWSAVAVISPEHFVPPQEIEETDLLNAFMLCRDFTKRIITWDPSLQYHVTGWNFLPPACSSQLHAHLQAFPSAQPMALHKTMLDGSRDYLERTGRHWWRDFVDQEKQGGGRHIATIGGTEWFTSWVSRSWFFDVTAVIPGSVSILDLGFEQLRDLVRGLKNCLRYMSSRAYDSFNLALYSGILGENGFWTHARLIQRGVFPPLGQADMGTFQLLGGAWTMLTRPEQVCRDLKPYFGV